MADQVLPIPPLQSVWRHQRSGRDYIVVAIANRGSHRPLDFPLTVIYRDRESHLWAQPLERWAGRFKRID